MENIFLVILQERVHWGAVEMIPFVHNDGSTVMALCTDWACRPGGGASPAAAHLALLLLDRGGGGLLPALPPQGDPYVITIVGGGGGENYSSWSVFRRFLIHTTLFLLRLETIHIDRRKGYFGNFSHWLIATVLAVCISVLLDPWNFNTNLLS
jgi:hypothetical protein